MGGGLFLEVAIKTCFRVIQFPRNGDFRITDFRGHIHETKS